MSARRISVIDFAGALRPIAGHRAATGAETGAGKFEFDPEAWVDLAYPCQETVMAEIGGKKVRRKARFTAAGFHKMVSAFEAEKARLAAAGQEHSLLGNRDHLALQGEGTEAYGWLDGLKVGDDGHLWGHVKWTTLGIEAAAGGVYRFVSVEVKDTTGAQKPADAVLEWDLVEGFAVTNQPALSRLRPFAHRDGETIEEKENPKGPKMENLKKMLGLAPEATDAEVEAKVKELLDAKAAADTAAAEADMSKKALEFAGKHSKAFPDEAAAVAFYRAAPEKAEELVGRFRVVELSATEADKELEKKGKEFAAKHSAKFVDEAGALAFFRAQPDQAEALAAHIRIPVVSHRGGGSPDEVGGGALSPKAAYSKYQAMPEGPEKEKFFDEHVEAINAGEYEEKSQK
jgi:phage I-like protein